MEKIFKNYKFWVIVSATILLMLIGVCIFSFSNYSKANDYSEQLAKSSNQEELVSKLNEENKELKNKLYASQTANTTTPENSTEPNTTVSASDTNGLSRIFNTFVQEFIADSTGTKTSKQKIESLKTYLSDKLYDKLSKNASGGGDAVKTTNITELACQQLTDNTAVALGIVDIDFKYSDGSTDYMSMLVKLSLSYNAEKQVWQITALEECPGVSLTTMFDENSGA